MSSKKYQSGAAKRKAAKERDNFESKLPKLTSFFSCQIENVKNIENVSVNIPSASDIDSINVSDVNDVSENAGSKSSGSECSDVGVDEKDSHDPPNEIENATGKNIIITDPALWPIKLHDGDKNEYINVGCEHFRNRSNNYKASLRKYKNQNRCLSDTLFERVLANGEKHERKWLLYSNSTGNVFCYVCKLFGTNSENSFVKDGFSNWKKSEEKVSMHENSQEHKQSMITWLLRVNEAKKLREGLATTMQSEIRYWTEVLKRIVAVIRFLATRGLGFRGDDERVGSSTNGNYLGLLELIAEFDPFLEKHLKLHGNKGRGNVSYLSKTICEEFIKLLAEKVLAQILSEIREAKYFALIVDSTPDLSHVDQLTIVIRYCLNGSVFERSLCFLPIHSHTGESLSFNVLSVLEKNGIDIENCRAQTYDNASNMSGKYSGLQAHIRQKNELAYYVPCAGHSLNLVGECSVDVCSEAIRFFMFLQKLYAFFVASTHRWNILSNHTIRSVKNLCATRWSCRYDAAAALKGNYQEIHNALSELADNAQENQNTRDEAESLKNKLLKLETAIMAILWHRILQRFNSTSKFLQKVDIDLVTADNMLKSLVEFVIGLRDKFDDIEECAKAISSNVSPEYSSNHKRKITKKYADCSTSSENGGLDGRESFRVSSFLPIIDKLRVELEKRSNAYSYIATLFGFLTNLNTIEMDELKECTDRLCEIYPKDLDAHLTDEVTQFISLLKKEFQQNIPPPTQLLKWIVDKETVDVFPNIFIVLRIFLTIPVSNCGGERAFSKLSFIENKYRTAMEQVRLTSLSMLCIERDLTKTLNFDDVIQTFAQEKARKKISE